MFFTIKQRVGFFGYTQTETLCDELWIEADDIKEATEKMEKLGCNFETGLIIQWDRNDIQSIDTKSPIEVWARGTINSACHYWYKDFGDFEVAEEPVDVMENPYYTRSVGKIIVGDKLETYAQLMANKRRNTTPQLRIFYKDGRVSEFISQ